MEWNEISDLRKNRISGMDMEGCVDLTTYLSGSSESSDENIQKQKLVRSEFDHAGVDSYINAYHLLI